MWSMCHECHDVAANCLTCLKFNVGKVGFQSSCGGKTLELRGCSRERYQEHKDVRLKDFNFNTNSEDRRLALCSQKEK